MASQKANVAATQRARNRAFLEALKHYGGKCKCCGVDKVDFLSLDHINGDGAARRKQGEPTGANLAAQLKAKGYPTDIQVLCFNCNRLKRQNSECPCPSSPTVDDALAQLPAKVFPPAGVGSNNVRSRYTEEVVLKIRKEYIRRKVTQRKLAEKYGGDVTTIQQIIARKTWKHI